jgi:hypothetical protein
VKRPLKVYLDNADFSDLSKPDISVDNVNLLQRLVRFKDTGDVEFFFSIVHVFEGSAADVKFLAASLGRFKLISQLCGANCFCDPYSLMRGELKAGGRYESCRRSDGWWLPIERPLEIELPAVSDVLNDVLNESNISLSQRQKIRSALIDRHGRPTLAGQKLLTQHSLEAVEMLSQRFPIRPNEIPIVIDVFLGRRPRIALTELIERSLIELNQFHDWHFKKWDEMGPLFQWLRDEGKSFQELLQIQRSKFGELIRQGSEQDFAREKIDALAKGAIETIRRSLVERIVPDLGDGRPIDLLGNLPGLTSFIELIIGNVSDSTLRIEKPRQPLKSDFGDSLHSVYAPYVDVFRADAHTSQKLRSIPFLRNVRIVPNLRNLPEMIESALIK